MFARFAAFPLVCAIAVARAVLAPAIPPRARAGDALKREAFADLAKNERGMRRKAADDFPTDPWSQNDAFQADEGGRAQSFADGHHVALTDVLAAYDEGLRRDKTLTASVPPCHPRAFD